jgi:hypothetical protein
LAEDLFDTQETITHGVKCEIQEVATTLQGFQMVLQFLATEIAELQVGDKDTGTFEIKAVRHTFSAQHGRVRVPIDPAFLARIQGGLENVQ